MAYTVIEVQKHTGMPSRTLRFWLDKGLFPFVERDENGVRYFSAKDVEWVHWIHCYRKAGMSLKQIKDYIHLCAGGKKTAQTRLEIITKQHTKVLKEMEKLSSALHTLEFKMKYYQKLIDNDKDGLNLLSKDYHNPCAIKRKRIVKDY